jgi:hypothetical protein
LNKSSLSKSLAALLIRFFRVSIKEVVTLRNAGYSVKRRETRLRCACFVPSVGENVTVPHCP